MFRLSGSQSSFLNLLLKHKILLICFLIICCFTVYFYRINEVPPVRPDETWESLGAYALTTEHKIAYPNIERQGWNKAVIQPRIVQPILLFGFYKLFGITIFVGRVFSLLIILISSGIFSLIIYDYFSSSIKFALIGTLIFLCDSSIFYSARTIRPESLLVFFTTLSFYGIVRYLKTHNKKFLLLAGLISGIGLYTHLNFLIVIIGLLSGLIFSKIRLNTIKHYLIGLVVGLLPFLIYLLIMNHYVNVVELFVKQMGLYSEKYNPLLINHSEEKNFFLSFVLKEFKRFNSYAKMPWRIVPAIAFFVVPLWGLLHKKIRPWALSFFIQMLFMLLLIKTDRSSYLVIFSPLLLFIIMGFVIHSFLSIQKYKPIKKIYIIGPIFILFIFIQHIFVIAGWQLKNRNLNFELLSQNIYNIVFKVKNASNHDRITGPFIFWFTFNKKNYQPADYYLKDIENFNPEFLIVPEEEVPKYSPAILQFLDRNKSLYQLIGRTNTFQYYGSYKVFKMNEQKNN